jgi:hypothetical protein
MPFDATGIALSSHLIDHLIAIGVAPVPLSVVDTHKRAVVEEFSASMHGRSLVRNGAATWRALHLYRELEILECPRKHLGMTNDVSAAPREIIELADRVARKIENAEFELEWFYTDPVLNVICTGQRACLGIWDNGRVVAIAGHDGCAPVVSLSPAPPRAFWRRWLRMARIGS